MIISVFDHTIITAPSKHDTNTSNVTCLEKQYNFVNCRTASVSNVYEHIRLKPLVCWWRKRWFETHLTWQFSSREIPGECYVWQAKWARAVRTPSLWLEQIKLVESYHFIQQCTHTTWRGTFYLRTIVFFIGITWSNYSPNIDRSLQLWDHMHGTQLQYQTNRFGLK